MATIAATWVGDRTRGYDGLAWLSAPTARQYEVWQAGHFVRWFHNQDEAVEYAASFDHCHVKAIG